MVLGVSVVDLGMTGTDEMYFSTSHLNVNDRVAVIAIHNPINYNGMKLVKSDPIPISGDAGLFNI